MRAVQLKPVEAGSIGTARGGDKLLAHLLHVGPRHGARHLVVRAVGQRAGCYQRPVAFGQRFIHALPAQLGRTLGAAVTQLQTNARTTLALHKTHDARERGLLFVVPQPGAAGRDAALRRRAGHLHHHQCRATQRPGAQVHQMEVLRHAVNGAVGGHGRHHHPVCQRQLAHAIRCEHRQWRCGRRRLAQGDRGQPAFITLQPGRIAHAQVLVADALAAREQGVAELLDRHVGIARDVLEPFSGIARRVLNAQHLDAAARLVTVQNAFNVAVTDAELIGQVDRIFHRQLGAAADREMRGVGGIAHQHDGHVLRPYRLPVDPVLADHAREANPVRRAAQVLGIAHQRIAVQVLGKQPLAKGDGFLLAHAVQTMGQPDRLRGLDDEGRGVLVELVGMGLEPAMLGLFEDEGEGVKQLVRAQPDKTATPHVDVRLVAGGVALAHPAVQAVGGHHQIGVVFGCKLLVVNHFGLEHQVNAQLYAALQQHAEQTFASDAAKAMAGGTQAAALEVDLDVVPVVERRADVQRRRRVRHMQVRQRLVRQHHTPAKGIERPMPLDHGDLEVRIALLHQQREVQARRAAA